MFQVQLRMLKKARLTFAGAAVGGGGGGACVASQYASRHRRFVPTARRGICTHSEEYVLTVRNNDLAAYTKMPHYNIHAFSLG